MTPQRFTFFDSISIGLVSTYLLVVGFFLVLSRRIPAPGVFRILRALARSPYQGTILTFEPEQGHCFVAALPPQLLSDLDSASSLALFEDGRRLGPAHASHDSIRTEGHGRFSHWGSNLYFSTSDNSSPQTNGRSYTIREERQAQAK
jgi:hypothetical protein